MSNLHVVQSSLLELSHSTKAGLAISVKRGYKISLDLLNQAGLLTTDLGWDALPHLRRVLIEQEIIKLINDRKIDLNYRTRKNAKDNCSHSEFLKDNMVISVSYSDGCNSLPREAIFRRNLSLSNQLILPYEPTMENPPFAKDDNYYAILVHGSSNKYEPDFISLGIPAPGAQRWLDRPINILACLETEEDVAKEENIVEEKLIHIRKQENIEEVEQR